RVVHHVARPDQVIATAVFVSLRLAPGNAERCDHRSGIGLVLVSEKEAMARVIEAPAIAADGVERIESVDGSIPLLDEPLKMLFERKAERLQDAGARAVKAVPEADAERELARVAQVELADERDVAVFRGVELPVEHEVRGQVGPAVRGSDVTARTAQERDR